jgi:hypothetical protein
MKEKEGTRLDVIAIGPPSPAGLGFAAAIRAAADAAMNEADREGAKVGASAVRSGLSERLGMAEVL